MRQLASRLGPPLERLVSAFWAGLLWAFAAVPLVTLFSSTAALTSVITERRKKNESPTWRLFKDAFLAHLKQTVPAALLWGVAAFVLWADLFVGINARAGMPVRVVAAAVGVLGAIVATGSAVFLFQLVVNHPAPLKVQVRNALLLALANIGTTLLCTLLLAAGVFVSYLAAPLLPFVGYAVTWCHQRLTARAVSRTLAKARPDDGPAAADAADAGAALVR